MPEILAAGVKNTSAEAARRQLMEAELQPEVEEEQKNKKNKKNNVYIFYQKELLTSFPGWKFLS